MDYRQINAVHELADDAIMVDVQADRTARVRSATIEPNAQFHPMPDALRYADTWLSREPFNYKEIVVYLYEGATWEPEWGTLIRS